MTSYTNRKRKASSVPIFGRRTGSIVHFDYSLLFIVMILCGFGLIMIYSASSYSAAKDFNGDTAGYFKRQLIAVVLGFIAMFAAYKFNYQNYFKKYGRLAFIIFIISILSVLLLFSPIAIEVNGAKRWLDVGPFTIQPAEIVKLGVILISAYAVTMAGKSVAKLKKFILIFLICGVFPAGLVYVISSNLSSAIIILLICFFMTCIANANSKIYIVLGVAVTVALIIVMIYANNATPDTSSFRLNRIFTWLHPEDYMQGQGYQTMQSLYAIGSGGLFGRGLGGSFQKLSYIPEAQNDMIFAVICEEFGIIGAAILLFVFLALLWRLLVIARHAPDLMSKLVVMGIFFHMALQVFLNVMVATNTMPNTGVTLPFISYGGSSIIILLMEMGIALNISSQIKLK